MRHSFINIPILPITVPVKKCRFEGNEYSCSRTLLPAWGGAVPSKRHVRQTSKSAGRRFIGLQLFLSNSLVLIFQITCVLTFSRLDMRPESEFVRKSLIQQPINPARYACTLCCHLESIKSYDDHHWLAVVSRTKGWSLSHFFAHDHRQCLEAYNIVILSTVYFEAHEKIFSRSSSLIASSKGYWGTLCCSILMDESVFSLQIKLWTLNFPVKLYLLQGWMINMCWI